MYQVDSPRKIFNLLFQVNENEKTQRQVLAEDRSILDAVFAQARSMEKRLNATDRAKMDEYLTSVREVEQTVKRRAYWADRSKPQVDYELEGLRPQVGGRLRRHLARACRPGLGNRFDARGHGTDSVLGRLQGTEPQR